MKWPSLVSSLSSNNKLFDQLQESALKPENEDRFLKNLIKDGNLRFLLRELLRYGCIEKGHISQNVDYTLSGLDFSKLLQISPVVAYPEDNFSGSLPEAIREMEFALIPVGEFKMGSSDDEVGRYDSEGPVHKITIKNPFNLGKYPVTQKQWVAIMGSNPSRFKGDDRPVENVSWNDVQEFLKKLNELRGNDKYRLPSEAEWEYACRANTTTRFYFGDDELKLGKYAWYSGNSGGETHHVGKKEPNSWKLYDMHGNVWEWVQDSWRNNYNDAPSDGSAWRDENSSDRVLRGGGWSYFADSCRSANRRRSYSGSRGDALSFRLVRE
ncbi:MAG: formylglycine-generating enzyme family protein [Methanosarcina barkeri]|nr:formylglycine-generating enzyme family protein [Methanosarcina sp. ERenArc_MAG2]